MSFDNVRWSERRSFLSEFTHGVGRDRTNLHPKLAIGGQFLKGMKISEVGLSSVHAPRYRVIVIKLFSYFLFTRLFSCPLHLLLARCGNFVESDNIMIMRLNSSLIKCQWKKGNERVFQGGIQTTRVFEWEKLHLKRLMWISSSRRLVMPNLIRAWKWKPS